jgi:anti-anti-sigma regulatory factor
LELGEEKSWRRGRELILDLSGVSFLDRKGAGLVQRLEEEACRRGWRVGVVATPTQAVLLGGLESQVYPTYSDALDLWRREKGEEEDLEGLVTRL